MKIENLSFKYQKKEIFDDLNITFSKNKLNVILGPNGTGKTTLLDLIAGIYFDKTKSNLYAFPSQKDIAYKLQALHFFPSLTVKQTLQMYKDIDHKRTLYETTTTMDEIGENVLNKIEQEKVGKLSGGELQIVLTYGTCLLNRKLYLFDEPLSGVDLKNTQLIIQILVSLVTEQQKSVIITSHEINTFKDIPVNLIVLNNKKCTFSGSYSELLKITHEDDVDQALRKLI